MAHRPTATLKLSACLAAWLACMLGVASAQAPSSAKPTPFDRWYVVELDGERAGTYREQRTVADAITTTTTLSLRIRRGSAETTQLLTWTFTESLEGEPLTMRQTRGEKQDAQVVTHRFEPDAIIETTLGREDNSERTLPPAHHGTLTPAQADRELLNFLHSGAAELQQRVFDPFSGPRAVTRQISRLEQIRTGKLGSIGTAWRVRITPVMPSSDESLLTSEDLLFEDGTPIERRQPLGSLEVTLRLVDQAAAEAPFTPADVLVRMFVHPSEPITSPRRTSKAQYLVAVTSGNLPEWPNSGSQIFSRLDETSARINITPKRVQAADEPAKKLAGYLASSPLVNANDPAIQRFATNLLAASPNATPAEQAELLRRGVHRHLARKDLATGFASASQTLRARTGDCTEHALLLAACLRSVGIPSRAAIGLVYAERFERQRDVFVFHMWTQALMETSEGLAWVDLDATLDHGRAFDATHIIMATDALAGSGAPAGVSEALGLLDRLTIEVELIE